MRLFFATDVHGSEICWKKFIAAGKFYEVDTLILGGDMTGKAIIPIIDQGHNKWKVTLLEQETILEGKEEVDKMAATIMNRGYYPHITTPEEVAEISSTPGRSDTLFSEYVLGTVARWMEYADQKLAGTGIRCFVSPGNDDVFAVDNVVAGARSVQLAEGKVVPLDDQHEMVSTGWSNPTPWNTHREEEEDALKRRMEAMISQVKDVQNSVFNLHAPPYGSGLDEAPELTKDMRLAYAGRSMVNVGSKAVLEVIEKYKPLLSLHGHIHEGKGTRKFGRTLCINAGSQYEQGILQGIVVELGKNKINSYVLTTG
jgi:hypothetical protein